MDKEKFQELVIEKMEKIAKRQSNSEYDFKSMLKIMEKFSEKLDKIEGTVVKIENNSTAKVRALFDKADIHDYRLEEHETRLKTLEKANKQ